MVWSGLIAMNDDERSWAYDQSSKHHVGKHEALRVYRGRRCKSLGNVHFNVVTDKHIRCLTLLAFFKNTNLQENCDDICSKKAMPWTLFNLLEWGGVIDKCLEGLIVLQLRIADVWRCHRCPPKEQCNPRPPCILAKPRDRSATVEILLFEEMQCHHRKRLKNNQNVKRVSDKSWFHRVTN